MCERARRFRDLAGTPRTAWTRSDDFFDRLEARRKQLPVYQGELYLEYHRGTYTTQTRNKRANRKSEFLLHDAEFIATYARACATAFRINCPLLRMWGNRGKIIGESVVTEKLCLIIF